MYCRSINMLSVQSKQRKSYIIVRKYVFMDLQSQMEVLADLMTKTNKGCIGVLKIKGA